MIERLYEIYENSSGICTDTRKIKKGAIFFALKGDNFNGNLFAEEAIEKGCACAVVDEDVSKSVKILKVDDVLNTLQELAKLHRSHLEIPVIGLTGSNGKTTTKELIRVVLETSFNTVATEGNLNNHIGVPLTILSIRKRHQVAVIEMGANHPGEIKSLSEIAGPDYGIITNIGKAHLEGFGGFEGVKRTKNELYDFLKAHQGKILFDKDNSILTDLVGNYFNVSTYGTKDADIEGEFLGSNPYIQFKWKTKTFTSDPISTKLIGRYNFSNILAAIATGIEFNIRPQKISEAISRYTPDNNRSQVVEGKNTVIFDAYNANPTSMKAALQNFAEMDGDKVFILGDMFELGESSHAEHQEIINLLDKLQLKQGILVGENFKATEHRIKVFTNTSDAKAYLDSLQLKGKLILVKGSRGVKLEDLKKVIT